MIEKVLFDTDIGSDIDDAFCLAYLLRQPKCRLMGITTVTNDARERAALVSALCRAAGQEVPIFSGANQPLVATPIQKQVPQYAYLGDAPHAEEFPTDAVEFMRRVIVENPGEITLLAVGPLTNVALLFSIYPETAGLIKQLVIMGGHFERMGEKGEWNIDCDPHAAKIVFETRVPSFKMVGLDVTLQVQMQKEEVVQKCTGPVLPLVAQLANAWFEKRDVVTFHDPLAAVALFNDQCTYRQGRASVIVDQPRGGTPWVDDPEGPHLYANSVNAEGFWQEYFSVTQE